MVNVKSTLPVPELKVAVADADDPADPVVVLDTDAEVIDELTASGFPVVELNPNTLPDLVVLFGKVKSLELGSSTGAFIDLWIFSS